MKITLHTLLILTLLQFLFSCNTKTPDTSDWKNEHQKFKNVVNLYKSNKLRLGTNNARVERVIPDSLKVLGYDSLAYSNLGSRSNINDGTFSLAFYKLEKNKKRTQEIVFTTQESRVKKLEKSKNCIKVAPNWYVKNYDE